VPRHPFEVFGLTPDLVAELDDQDLFGVIKSMYRSLLKAFHPDKAKSRKKAKDRPETNEKRTVELNLAFEVLNLEKDPDSFKRLKKSYLSRQPTTAYRNSLLLKAQLEAQQDKEDHLAQSYLSYLAQAALPTEEELLSSSSAPLPAKGVCLGLSDVAITNNVRQSSWFIGSNFKELKIDPSGQMYVKQVGRSKFSQANFIHLLGSVPVDAIELIPLLERGEAKSFRSLPSNGSYLPKVSVLNLVGPKNFKRHVLPLLKPLLLERAYLFSLNNETFLKSGLITLEGVIVKFDRLRS
jgi:hypothetical protein